MRPACEIVPQCAGCFYTCAFTETKSSCDAGHLSLRPIACICRRQDHYGEDGMRNNHREVRSLVAVALMWTATSAIAGPVIYASGDPATSKGTELYAIDPISEIGRD